MDNQTLRDEIAQELKLWRRVFLGHPVVLPETANWRKGIVLALRRFAQRCTYPQRTHRKALAEVVGTLALSDPAHYTEAHRLAQQVRHG